MAKGRRKEDEFAWEERHFDFAIKLWNAGRGSQVVTDAMNDEFYGEPGTPLSRSAVSGKLWRRGLRRGTPNHSTNYTGRNPLKAHNTVIRRRKPRPADQSPLPGASEAARRKGVRDPLETPKAPVLVFDAETDRLTIDQIRHLAPLARNGAVVTVETLETHDCKFPIGDPKRPGFGFCARPRGDGPYCAAHARLVGDKDANAAVKRSSTIADPRAFRFNRRRA